MGMRDVFGGVLFLVYAPFRIILEIILWKAVDNMWGK